VITYTVFIDGKPVGTTTDTRFTPPVRVRDGRHRLQIVATDQRGQTSTTASTVLNVDDTPPSLKVKIVRSGTTVTVLSRAHDKRSGLKSIVTSFGDGSSSRPGARVTHRYRRSGAFKLVVRATDQAGARRLSARTIRVKKR
jgi:hypothetical protein